MKPIQQIDSSEYAKFRKFPAFNSDWKRRFKTPDGAQRAVDAAFNTAKSEYEHNLPIAQQNKETMDAVKAVLDSANIKHEWRINVSSGRRPRWVNVRVGSDVVCGVQDPTGLYNRYCADIAAWRKEFEQQQRSQQRAKEKAQEQVANERVLGVLAAKYEIPPNAEVEEIIDAILKRNKYLHLAYWMQRNRGDWTDGPHFASIGLDAFTVETERDEEIYNCISGHINDWDGDGRVFRDCEWNYDRLYAFVRENAAALVEDLKKVEDIRMAREW